MPRHKNSRKSAGISLALLLCIAVAVAAAIYPDSQAREKSPEIPAVSANEADLLDVKMPAGLPAVKVNYTGFYVSFNPEMHQPNFAAWELNPDEVDGAASRKEAQFRPDPDVEGCASLDDYRGSGYDRGHMAPAADMKWSQQAMDDCHYLTNICPQDRKLNGGPWATVEKNSRKWATRFGPLYIIAGPIPGDRLTHKIGSVPVPERFFKVIIAPQANPPRGIAFLMPNAPIPGGAQATVTSIDRIEEISGYDFFHSLPDAIENEIEAQHNLNSWNH